ncbi:AAA-like domain-containing protein [Chondromyces apiculatus]|uniref:Uncharacterized protein n=1 Tax=Chondromyces apiculatus DSM 436 TaxID=1192034 RepID=A0A017TH89_9BACT|nr:AAA-like domain-containing protein [Chondromyces apiculatus]EYF08195.1 Hypothetical protein CAP_5955 [Chondromyces apiculatus DSM 436]
MTAPDSAVPSSSQSFQTEGRGIVDADGQGFYVVRKSDAELFERLLRREPCYVLAPRQIGKSSLRIRTQERLRGRGVRCVSIDLTSIGSGASADEWYFSIAAAIHEDLGLDPDLDELWRKNRRMSPVRRFRQFLGDVVLGEDDEGPPVVIFLDEIDVTLGLPFSRDDFFGLIRSAREARADAPRWGRLTFCLIGVAAPLDLVADPERTPFNNSFEVRLDDFSREEARTFLPGLANASADPEALLGAVLDWTSGHPALTQRLCYHLCQQSSAGGEAQDGDSKGGDSKGGDSKEGKRKGGKRKSDAARVKDLVDTLFLDSGRISDPILLDAERRFAGDRADARIPVMLHLYGRLLNGEDVDADGNNPRQFGLRIAGLAAERKERLDPEELSPEEPTRSASRTRFRLRNRIFASVFDRAWVDERLARRFLTEPLQIWKDSGRKEDHVLRGDSLRIALAWAKGRDDVTPDEHDFLQASQEEQGRAEAARQQAEVERARRERAEQAMRSQRRVVSILATSIALLGVLMIVVIILYSENQRALQEKSEALASEQQARSVVENAYEERVARARDERVEAERLYKEAQKAHQDAEEAAKRKREEAKVAEEEARLALSKAPRWSTERLKAERKEDAAQKVRKEADRLDSKADDAARGMQSALQRYTIADRAVATLEDGSPQGASIAGSVKGAIEAEQGETRRLSNLVETQKEALTSAQKEIEDLRETQRDLEAQLAAAELEKATLQRELNAARAQQRAPVPSKLPAPTPNAPPPN